MVQLVRRQAIDSFVAHTPATVAIENRPHRPALHGPTRTHDGLGRDREVKFRHLGIIFGR